MGAGQFCTNPGIAVRLPAGAAGDAFVATMAEALRAVAPQVMLTEGIARAYREGKARFDSPQCGAPGAGDRSTGREASPEPL